MTRRLGGWRARPVPNVLIAALLTLGVAGCSGAGAHSAPQRHVVEIRGSEYHPRSLTVAIGDTVVWVNRDVVPHTATAEGERWNSGSIAPDARWSRVVSEADRGEYSCAFHPGMSGRIVIR